MIREGFVFPLSFAQQRLWFFEQLAPGTAVYNLPVAYRLHGPLDVTALEQSFNEIVRRHEILRTTFADVAAQPVQVITPILTVALAVVDLQCLLESAREAEIRRLAVEESRRPFDLTEGPLLRVTLLRLGREEHVLLLTMHHIVSDGWSIGVLFRELSVLYNAFSTGNPSPLSELPIQYADFAVWQRERLQGDTLQTQLSYWRKQLMNLPAALELPTDRPRPPAQTYRGARQATFIPRNVSEALRALCQREGVTLFMVILAAFKTLLYRYTGRHDIVVGTPIAGRDRTELEGLIGFFVNTMVLRTDLSDNPTFTTVIGRVREVALKAYLHQELPFEKLVEELQPERDRSRSLLFQVMFQFRNFYMESLHLAGVQVEEFEFDTGIAKFDLTLDIIERAGGIACLFRYNTDLFDDATISRMGEHFNVLLEAISGNAKQRISDLPLLTAREKRQLLTANGRPRKYIENRSIHQLVEAQAKRTPEAVALVFEDQYLTYRQLNARANRLAHYLRKRGAGPEALVGIFVERSLEMVIGVLAILKSGSAYVPLDPEYPKARLTYILAETKIDLLLSKERLLKKLPEFKGHALCLDRDSALFEKEQEENPDIVLEPNNLAYVMYTSGSTGKPKGVLVCHRSVVNYLSYLRESYNLDGSDSVLQIPSLSFDASVRDLIGPLTAGAQVVIVNDFDAKEPAALLAKIKERGVTCILSIVPTLLNGLLEAAQSSDLICDSLRLILVSGEALALITCRRAKEVFGKGVLVVNQYGPTECTMTCSYYPVYEAENNRHIAPLGRPIPNALMYVLDGSLNLVPAGVAGEVHIGGVGPSRGYLNAPELTAERFIPNPFGTERGARLYKTGDLARYRSDGSVEFLGRIDYQVKVRGFRIEPGEVEAELRQHPSVKASVVVARDDMSGNQLLVAYVVPDGNVKLDPGELRNFLREKLPEYMVPSVFVCLDELPLTPNRKVDRNALPDPRQSQPKHGKIFTVPRTSVEKAITQIWQDVLRVEKVAIEENFFDLGGHSLQATQVMSRLRNAFHVELPLRRLFERPTVAGLARCIEEELGSERKQHTPALCPISRYKDFPLSFAQQRLWFLEQMEPVSHVYNVAAAFRITGRLNVAVLERSLNEIVRRHEVLRTCFSSVEGTPVQAITPALRLRVPVIDLSSIPKREVEAVRLATEEARLPFDLAQAPMLRVSLLRLGGQEHVLLLTMHHIISDGWSLEIFFRELSALYRAFSQEKPSPLPDLSIQYTDFARWQRQWLQGDTLENQLRYWKQQLKGVPSLLQLPTDRPRPAVQSFRGARQSVVLPKTLTDALYTLSRREEGTLFMMLLAAFQVLLYRYTGQEDIVVGSPIANRNRRESEELIGFFVNTLLLRADLSGNPTFRELLSRVREIALEAYEHQDLPFEKLVEELQPERDLGRNPLFQVMFLLLKDPVSDLELSGLTLSLLKVDRGTSKFDLTLHMIEGKEGLKGIFEYNTDLFDDATIARMLGHWQTLLESIVADPGRRLLDLPILTEEERHQSLLEWNDTKRDYPKDKRIHELFEAQVERTPEAVAAVFEDKHLTYRELNHRANQLAHYLRKLGIGAEVLVGICMERSLEMVVALLGILKAGGAYVPLDPDYPKERVEFMLNDARVPVVVTRQRWVEKLLPRELKAVRLDVDSEIIDRQSEKNLISGAEPENPAYVIYTSGSTGTPKGVLIEHRQIVNYVKAFLDLCGLENGASFAMIQPLSVDASQSVIFPPLISGGSLYVVPDEVALDARSFCEYFQHRPIDLLKIAPSHFAVLLASPHSKYILPRKRLVLGGEACNWSLIEAVRTMNPDCVIINHYGPTETTVGVVAYKVQEGDNGQRSTTVPLGRPMANTQIYTLDSHLKIVPIGVCGEIYVGGAGLARGYLNRPDLTAANFVPNPFSDQAGARLYKTGDFGRYLPDGNIEFLGRTDQQVKIRGFRVEPGEIEAALRQYPPVAQVVVAARTDAAGDQRLVAYLVAEQEQLPTTQELRNFLCQKLPDYMIPSSFVFLDALPRTPHGKVDRQALPAPAQIQVVPGGGFTTPRNGAEQVLAEIWTEVLGLERVSIHDNFFELGGHSLKAMQLASKISAAMRIELSVKLLFMHPTIAELARVLGNSSEEVQGAARTQTEVVAATRMCLKPSCEAKKSTLVEVERRPLLSLFAAGKIAPVDAAAIGYLANELPEETGLDKGAVISDWYNDLPLFSSVLETSLGRIATIILPRFPKDFYSDEEGLIAALLEALELSGRLGARVVSLTGLIPSATDYGRAVAGPILERKALPRVSTGHATTVATVVLALERILREAGRDLARERVGFLGLGSIGLTTLQLMLKCLPHPSEILLCDIYSKRESMMKVQHQILESGFLGSQRVLQSSGQAPPEFYDATLIIGATNVPEILDITQVRPGSIIVDDSGPHCFVIKDTIQRFRRDEDILFTEGGVLLSPHPVRRLRYLPRLVEEKANHSYLERFSRHHPFQITGCVLSSLLSCCFPDLKPTLGLVDANEAFQHYEQLKKLGFQAAALHCRDYVLAEESVHKFRQRFGNL